MKAMVAVFVLNLVLIMMGPGGHAVTNGPTIEADDPSESSSGVGLKCVLIADELNSYLVQSKFDQLKQVQTLESMTGTSGRRQTAPEKGEIGDSHGGETGLEKVLADEQIILVRTQDRIITKLMQMLTYNCEFSLGMPPGQEAPFAKEIGGIHDLLSLRYEKARQNIVESLLDRFWRSPDVTISHLDEKIKESLQKFLGLCNCDFKIYLYNREGRIFLVENGVVNKVIR